MISTLLAVSCGGALGALARFGIAQIPFLSGQPFPWMTFAANILGALIIGFIAGAALTPGRISPSLASFAKTGFCGALTTFSTFSLEALTLFENGHPTCAAIYIAASVTLCLAGVFAGRLLAMRCFG